MQESCEDNTFQGHEAFSFVRSEYYGQQGLLTASALGGFFIVLTPHSFLLAAAGAAISTMVSKLLFAVSKLPFKHYGSTS